MAKKNMMHTPNSKITGTLRRLFLYSREHSYTLKRDKYTCQECLTKRTSKNKIKLHVHHILGRINWNLILKIIREELLTDPDLLLTLCESCHSKKHLTKDNLLCIDSENNKSNTSNKI
jgi:5-methylcytosine-specific restriction endonuclease McrA